jgi:hypothetical protein
MQRIVEPEWLDALAPEDPGAIGSRRDLRRLNAIMRHPSTLARLLQDQFSNLLSLRIVELGAGDGDFLLSTATQLRGKWRRVEALLVDRHDLLTPQTRSRFAGIGWQVESARTDVFDWLRRPGPGCDVIVANLFLHHFESDPLRDLLAGCSNRTQMFVALEPRRWKASLLLSRLVRWIGCNAVTRHDAVVSVRAGFAGPELSALWPDRVNWDLTEQPAGWSSHLFAAARKIREPQTSRSPQTDSARSTTATAAVPAGNSHVPP